MASGTINGTVERFPTKYQYKIDWAEDNIDETANTSRVTAKIYTRKISDYSSYDASEAQSLTIDGNTSTGNSVVDLQTLNAWQLLRTHVRTITHDSNGTKTITISSSSGLGTGGGYGPISGSASGSAVLTAIPREAVVTNTPDFTIGNTIPLTISNAGNFWLVYELYIGATLIKTAQIGQVVSYTISPTSSEITAMYGQLPSSVSAVASVKIKTYQTNAYDTQVGTTQSKTCTAYVNTTTNKPTFSGYLIGNITSPAKDVAVTDKYGNALTTTTINSTLFGGIDTIIKGYSKLRCVITTSNKAIAKNGASMVKYTMKNDTSESDGAYSAVATVNIDIDNCLGLVTNVFAIDSRQLSTVVGHLPSHFAEYVPVSIWGMTLVRDNDIDTQVTLAFSAMFWKEYFGGGTNGTQNTITGHYRYKETTATWGAQTWNSITVTDDGSGNVSFSSHINGDLGASGFDANKSYNIEVRLYDKLSQVIIEDVLDKGIPLVDFHYLGVSVLGLYDDTLDAGLQVNGEIYRNGISLSDLLGVSEGYIANGWIASGETWTYASTLTYTNSNTTYAGTFTISGDKTGKYNTGMKIKLTQDGAVKYGIITKVAYSSPNTTITVFLGTDYSFSANPLSLGYYSTMHAPQGFPMDKTKWQLYKTDVSSRTQATPTQAQWYNLGAVSIALPIGGWFVRKKVQAGVARATTTNCNVETTLSTANNTESDSLLTNRSVLTAGSASLEIHETHNADSDAIFTVATTLYLNTRITSAAANTMYNDNDLTTAYLVATCLYL